jgi:predicted AAA+ superfamily ATPase
MIEIPRLLNPNFKHSFFLFGPRQVGKTTLIKKLFCEENTYFYNLLKISDFIRLQNNPEIIIEDIKARSKKITHVVIDEVQKLPEILDLVHYMIEELENPPIFILTGSSARKLKRGQANLLGGRALNYHLAPLTHIELINAEEKKITFFSLKKALEIGTLPQIYLADEREFANSYLESYVDIYLKEEIKSEAVVRNLGSFVEFLRFAAEENGNTLNYAKISQDIGVSASTVKEYFQILEDTLIAFFLKPYSRTIRKKIVKSAKFYFFDTGVQRALAKRLSQELIPKTKDYGKCLEHFIIKEFIHLSKYLNRDLDFSFYRTESGAEVDLIITTPSKEVYALEIKSSDAPRKQEFGGLRSFQKVCPEAKLCCLSLAPHKYCLDGITIYPWQEFFKEFFNCSRTCLA